MKIKYKQQQCQEKVNIIVPGNSSTNTNTHHNSKFKQSSKEILRNSLRP